MNSELNMGDGVTKAYLEPKDKFSSSPALVDQLRLMLAVDCMRASFRWYKMTKDDDAGLGKQDNLIAMMAMSGWTWECINTIRKGIEKKWLRRDMIVDDEKALEAWDRYIPEGSSKELVKRIERIRNECFGHWDPRPAKKCIRRLSSPDYEVPFIESQGGGFLNTRYPWVSDAIAGTLVDAQPGDTEKPDITVKWQKTVAEIAEAIGSLSTLMSSLAAAMLEDSGLRLVERND